MGNSILLGAVAYDPKVVTIWEGIRAYFRDAGVDCDFALFSNYERQVEELLSGHIDVAWNTPLGHVRVQKRTGGRSQSLGMRDSDRDFHAKVIVRRDAQIRSLGDLAGKTLAVGSRDSTQARILPLHFLRKRVALDRVKLLAFDTDLGKHGDTGSSGPTCCARSPTAGASERGQGPHLGHRAGGRPRTQSWSSVVTTPGFDHCMFDALPTLDEARARAFQDALFKMSWEEPAPPPAGARRP